MGGSSAGSYLAAPTSPIPSHCAVITLFKSVSVHQLSWLALFYDRIEPWCWVIVLTLGRAPWFCGGFCCSGVRKTDSSSGLWGPSWSNGSNNGNPPPSEKRCASSRTFWHSVSLSPSVSSVSSSTPESGRDEPPTAPPSSNNDVTDAVFTDSVLLAIPGSKQVSQLLILQGHTVCDFLINHRNWYGWKLVIPNVTWSLWIWRKFLYTCIEKTKLHH